MMPRRSKTGGAGVLLASLLCVPAFGQHRQQEQRQAVRREVPHPPRQERAFPRQNLSTDRLFPEGLQSRPGYLQRNARSLGLVGRPSLESHSSGNASLPEMTRREVTRSSAQTERRVEASAPQGMRRDVPRPPSASPYRNQPQNRAQEPKRVAQPPAAPPRSESAALSGQGHEVPRPPQGNAPPRQVPRPPAAEQRHGGDWLRSHQNLSPAEQEKALQNDPQFRKLPAQQQQRLVNRLQKFNSLPPQEQQRRLNRIETWEHLTPQQKQQARQLAQQWKQLSPDRQRMMKTAIGDLRAMPPEQRESVLESDRFKGMFSEQERSMLRETTKLPLAPAVPRPPQE